MNLGCLKKLAYTRVAPFENIDNPLNLSVRMTLLTVREMTNSGFGYGDCNELD